MPRGLLAADPSFSDADRVAFESIGVAIEPFLLRCLGRIDWSRYAIVGFTNTFQQTLASLALARLVKQTHPRITVCFGGAHCEGEMGLELLRQFPQVDLVFSGEADRTFPEVVAQVLAGGRVVPPCGVFGREGLLTTSQPPCSANRASVALLDELPVPNFDDYFARLSHCPYRDEIEPLLLFETARGCWWGDRVQCTFCGLNGGGIAFRGKSPDRALAELRTLRERYGVRRACATDNIFDLRYFRSLLPRLQDEKLDLEFEYELKPNLSRAQVEMLVASGLRAGQLGVESLSTQVLRRLRKGLTSIQNIQVLKWMTATGIEVKWNWLYGAPGEGPDDYADLPALCSRLVHLVPPQAVGPIRLDRFSPYFTDPESFGLSCPKPRDAYRFVYPFAEEVLARLAYYFTCGKPDEATEPPAYVRPTLAAIAGWQQAAGIATFRAWDVPDQGLILLDTRPGATIFRRRLTGLNRTIYLYCDSARSFRGIRKHLQSELPCADLNALPDLLDGWVREGLMTYRDGAYLSLALNGPDGPSPA